MPRLDPDLAALQEVRDAVERAHAAQETAASWTQEQTDRVCAAMAEAGARAAHDLARLAVEETGIGRVHYKILKNLFGSEGVWESIRDERTVGVITRDPRRGLVEVATPAGIVAAVVPTTNPTSTALGKALISVKGRNAVVMSPHPRARRCIGETAEVLRRAIERAGGPPDLVQSLSNPTIESTGALMKHRRTSIILATGGSGLVRAAYSSGKPAYGVGPGNVPAYVDRSADLAEAARGLVASQSFDNATFCCSEQALVLDRTIADELLAALVQRGAHLCDAEETKKLEAHCNRGGMMNPDVVGKDPWIIAEGAGFRVPRSTSLLLAHQSGVGREHPLSIEVLCPLLSVHVVDGWREACAVSKAILHYGGLGHTIGVWARDEAVLEAWFLEKPASRIVVNTGTSQGAVGYSTNLVPSLSLGCGPQAGNITSDNITARHLINVKRVGFPKSDWREREVRDLARAASMTGETAPRGSGLPGDPALRGPLAVAGAAEASPVPPAPAPAAPEPRSSWRGNPASPAAAPPPTPSGGRRRPPTFTAARASSAPPAPAAPVLPAGSGGSVGAGRASVPAASPSSAPAPAPAPALAPAPGAPVVRAVLGSPGAHVGSALTTEEIHLMMAHAGSGCPLGPCRGCPHNDVRTGACTA